MEKYDISLIKQIYNEMQAIVHEKTEESTERIEGEVIYNQEAIEQAKAEGWNYYFEKLEELYPGCLSSKEFANFFVENVHLPYIVPGQYADRFSGEGKQALIEKFSFYDYMDYKDREYRWSNILEKDIENGLTDEEWKELRLDSNDGWFEFYPYEMPIIDEEGQDDVRGFALILAENEYDEDGDVSTTYWDVGVFVPLDDFKKARISVANNKDRNQVNKEIKALKAVVETIQSRLPYNSIDELIDMVINKEYTGLETPYTRTKGYKEGKTPEGLTYKIVNVPSFKRAVSEMIKQAGDTTSDLTRITSTLGKNSDQIKGDQQENS